MVCAARARGDGGRCLCTGAEPRVDGGCCNGHNGLRQAQPWEPRGVQRLETSKNCPLHGLRTLELGYTAWPAWPTLRLVSPALSLAPRSHAVTLELTNSGTGDLQSPSPCMQAWCRLQELLQLMGALPGVLMMLWLSLLGCPQGSGSAPGISLASGYKRRLLGWGLWQRAASAVTLVCPGQPPPARRQPAPQ